MNEEFKNDMIKLYGSEIPKNIEIDPRLEEECKKNNIPFFEEQIMYRQQNYVALNDMFFRKHQIFADPYAYIETFTVNTNMLLGALYRVHAIHPEMNVSEKFKALLKYNAINIRNVLKYIYTILDFELRGLATFKIDVIPYLEKQRELLKRNNFFDGCVNFKDYEYAEFENGAIGMFEEYNEIFKSELGFDLFENNELYSNLQNSRKCK